MKLSRVLGGVGVALGAVAARDLTQKRHALMRNYPVIAHARYWLETIGPELRQYIVADNDEERPFSRDQRSWIYASSKQQNNYSGFGTDNDTEHTSGYAIIKHRTFAASLPHDHAKKTGLPSAKVLGAARGRAQAFRPASLVNISAMSFGSMSGNAIKALNGGALQSGCMHNTGEGGLSPYHRQGGDIVLQIGTAYFGCRDEQGRFSLAKLKEVVESAPVRAIEIKLSQGAKPGLGGLLPAAKVTKEISEIRGIPMGRDCASPSRHTAFHDEDSLLDFVELLAAETGLPVGIKSAVGDMHFWYELTRLMSRGDRGVDFITVDGGEGGTGASPPIFADSIALPFRMGFSRVYGTFAEAGLTDDVTFIGSAKLGLPDNAVVAFALGADMVNVAREAMMSIGCVQSQKCHTDRCPTGVATQDPWLSRGLDPISKAERCAQYIRTFRNELVKVSESIGVAHPGLITAEDVDIFRGDYAAQSLRAVYGYKEGWGELGTDLAQEIRQLMAPGGMRVEVQSIEEGEGEKQHKRGTDTGD
jgi:glutamate synthase domain-containing protein 2